MESKDKITEDNVEIMMPQFIVSDASNVKLHKYMFIRKGGKAESPLGDMSRKYLDAELICVSDEDNDNWIGNYASGLGFYNIRFKKTDCRDASKEEVITWLKYPDAIKF